MVITEAYRHEICTQLTKRIAMALGSQELPMNELPTVSMCILYNIDRIFTHDDLVDFLTMLTDKWTFFSTITKIVKNGSILTARAQIQGFTKKDTNEQDSTVLIGSSTT